MNGIAGTGLHPTPTLWVAVGIYSVMVLLALMWSAAARDEWPYFEGQYNSAAWYITLKLFATVANWTLGMPILIARFIVGVIILRYLGWLT